MGSIRQAAIWSKAFLYLKPAGETVNEPGEFANTVDSILCNITDMAFAKEWEHMMLTHAVDFDVTHDYHVVAFLMKYRGLYDISGVLLVSLH